MFRIEYHKPVVNVFGVPFNLMKYMDSMFKKKTQKTNLHAYREKLSSIKLVLVPLHVSQVKNFCFLSFVHSQSFYCLLFSSQKPT